MYRILVTMFFFGFLIFPVTSTNVSSVENGCGILGNWRVTIVNVINENIIIHVRSKDDDLGSHTLPYMGMYDWEFCDNSYTVFWSNFQWGSRFQSLNVYDHHIFTVCGKPGFGKQQCYWLVRPQGFYVGNRYPIGSWRFEKRWD